MNRKELINEAAKALFPGGDGLDGASLAVRAIWEPRILAAFAVFEQAYANPFDTSPERANIGHDSSHVTPTDDERAAAHKEAKRRYGRGEQQVRRRVAFEDGAAWAAGFRRTVQGEPSDAQEREN